MQRGLGLHSTTNTQSVTAHAVAGSTWSSFPLDHAPSSGVDSEITAAVDSDAYMVDESLRQDSDAESAEEFFRQATLSQGARAPLELIEPQHPDTSIADQNAKMSASNAVADLEKNKDSMTILANMADAELQRAKSKFPDTSMAQVIQQEGSLRIQPLLNFIEVNSKIDVHQKDVHEYLVKFLFRLFRERVDHIRQAPTVVQVMPVTMETVVERGAAQLDWPTDTSAKIQDNRMKLATSVFSHLKAEGVTWHSQKVTKIPVPTRTSGLDKKTSQSVKRVMRTVQKDAAIPSKPRCPRGQIHAVSKATTSCLHGSRAEAFASVCTEEQV